MVKIERSTPRTAAILALVFVLFGMPSYGQNTSCVPDLTDKLYYPSAVLARRIQGTVDSAIVLDSAANVIDIRSVGYPGLKDNVEHAIRSAQFGGKCVGEQFSIRVNFVIDPKIEPNSKPMIKRSSDSTYEVVAPAQTVVLTISDPPWSFTRRGRVLHRIHLQIAKLKFW